jgi:hypothetical protein
MRRQDHVQQPLLRRVIRRLPEARMDSNRRVQLFDVELSEPIGPLDGIESPVARIFVTAHGQALGMVDLSCADGTISGSMLQQAISSELGSACVDHLRPCARSMMRRAPPRHNVCSTSNRRVALRWSPW